MPLQDPRAGTVGKLREYGQEGIVYHEDMVSERVAASMLILGTVVAGCLAVLGPLVFIDFLMKYRDYVFAGAVVASLVVLWRLVRHARSLS